MSCLTEDILEDILGTCFDEYSEEKNLLIFIRSYMFLFNKLVKGCFVTKLQRAKEFREGNIPSILPPGFTYRIGGDKLINVEANDRELPYEVLFEQDGDQTSLSTMILDSILQVMELSL